jgi:NADH-quinone oxidoreductase subunit N
MFVGNFLALMQSNVKRILAYSSIAHLGYLLVAFVAGGQLAVEAVAYYFVVYFVTTLAAFGIIGLISKSGEEIVALDDYRGLFWSRPWISILFTAALLSLAGIPLTAGFIGKFLILTAGIGSSHWVLVFALVVNSAIGLFYYIRVAARMYSKPAEEHEKEGMPVSAEGGVVLMVLFFAIIYFGVYPGPTVQLIRQAVSGLF